jgi:A/G-specific adenine glycosylase
LALNNHFISQIQQLLFEWIEKNYEELPWRSESELMFALISEIMLQKTRAKNVLPVYLDFKQKYPTLEKIKQTETQEMLNTLQPLGLQKRNKNLIHMLKGLENDEPPQTKKELMALKGVGEYTANAYLSLHLNVKEPIIDTNAIRLWSRIFNKPWTSKDYKLKDFRDFATSMTPENNFKEFNYAVLDFARKICKPKPLCNECPINDFCCYNQAMNLHIYQNPMNY